MDSATRRIRTALAQGLVAVIVLSAAASRSAGQTPSETPTESSQAAVQPWQMGMPIVTYWAGPMPMTEPVARQMADGNWNLVWCSGRGAPVGDIEHYRTQLDVLQHHGLRGIVACDLFNPKSLDSPEQKARLDAFVDAVRTHPALYAYHLKDEPNASTFADLARMKDYLDQKDPSHLKYVNLFPNYATRKQLGTEDAPADLDEYEEYVRRFLEVFKPQLLSYDHYHFAVDSDGVSGDGVDGKNIESAKERYFLNLGQIRRAARGAGIPFMVIVQACSWSPKMRIPTGEEIRWLAHTTLAYGSQGISYYVYGYPQHDGGMMNIADGSPTSLYYYTKETNKEFVAIATELKPLDSVAVYHAGTQPKGSESLPPDAPFRIEPPLPAKDYFPGRAVEGYVVGCFGTESVPTHALVVNLDYRTYSAKGQPRREEFLNTTARSIVGPGRLEVFDATASKWSAADSNAVSLHLPPSGALLVRVAR